MEVHFVTWCAMTEFAPERVFSLASSGFDCDAAVKLPFRFRAETWVITNNQNPATGPNRNWCSGEYKKPQTISR